MNWASRLGRVATDVRASADVQRAPSPKDARVLDEPHSTSLRPVRRRVAPRSLGLLLIALFTLCFLAACGGRMPGAAPGASGTRTTSGGESAGSARPLSLSEQPLTVSAAIGRYDSARDASLRLVMAGLDEDARGGVARARASYQRAIRVDPTNPFAFLALARHHLEGEAFDEASAFLDQARALFETQGELGPAVDVWGLGLRAGIDRETGRVERADELLSAARALAPRIWGDGRLSAAELR